MACGLAMLFVTASCASDGTTEPSLSSASTFTVQVANETFAVRVSSTATLTAMRERLRTGAMGVIIGSLASGNGGFNTGYGWHLEPSTVAVADVAIELCDGRPSDVQQNMAYWLNTVRSYCPWSARVIAER